MRKLPILLSAVTLLSAMLLSCGKEEKSNPENGSETETTKLPYGPSKCLKFTTESGKGSFGMIHHDNNPSLECSEDGLNWEKWDGGNREISETKALYVRGNNPNGFNHSEQQYSYFFPNEGHVRCEGDIMSLISYEKDVLTIPNDYCFTRLFTGFWLTTAPDLPATTLKKGCYSHMFDNCQYLTAAPALPATVLAESCYDNMFRFCRSLTEGPELPATALAPKCYYQMFYFCKNLTYVKMMALEFPEDGECFYEWCDKSSSSDPAGTLVRNAASTWNEYGVAPLGWTVKVEGPSGPSKCLKFTTVSGTNTISLRHVNWNSPAVDISEDGENWTAWDGSEKEISETKALYVRGCNLDGFSHSEQIYSKFKASTAAPVKCEGDVMSLISYDKDILAIPDDYCFTKLFADFSALAEAPDLPATALTSGCYNSMFYSCTSLKEAPVLPARKLAEDCYNYMFYMSNSLESVTMLATDVSADKCLFNWLEYAGNSKVDRNLYVDPSMTNDQTINASKGKFTIKAYVR